MRKALALVLCLTAAVAIAATGITLRTGTRYEFTGCSSSGSSAQNVKAGTYWVRVLKEDVAICFSTTCPSGGEWAPAGTSILLNVDSTTDVSCRSAASTAVLVFTRGS